MPEAMFSVDKNARRKSRRQSTLVAGGVYGLGLGLAQRPDMLDTSFFDIFDVQHQFNIHFTDKKTDEDSDLTLILVLSRTS